MPRKTRRVQGNRILCLASELTKKRLLNCQNINRCEIFRSDVVRNPGKLLTARVVQKRSITSALFSFKSSYG